MLLESFKDKNSLLTTHKSIIRMAINKYENISFEILFFE